VLSFSLSIIILVLFIFSTKTNRNFEAQEKPNRIAGKMLTEMTVVEHNEFVVAWRREQLQQHVMQVNNYYYT
jgi:hypothetical protein